MITRNTWKQGLISGLQTSWLLGKVIFPITLIVTVLQYTPVIDWVVRLFQPIMGVFGLPGEAAIVLALGNVLNLYAAIGAILGLDLTVKHVFILAVMLSFSHSLPVETAVARKIGVKVWVILTVRLGLAFLSAMVIHLFWKGGSEQAVYGFVPESTNETVTGWTAILFKAFETASIGIVQLMIVVIPLMIAIQVLKDLQALQYLSKGMYPFTRLLGVSSKSAVTLVAGLLFGISFGAGVIIQSAKEENLSKRDLYLLSIFLVSCHAVVEDTLLFVPLGINVLPLLLIRLVVAFILTALTAQIWNKISREYQTDVMKHGG